MKKWVPLIVLSFVLVTFVTGHKVNEVVTDYLTELDLNIDNISKKHDTIVSDLQNNKY